MKYIQNIYKKHEGFGFRMKMHIIQLFILVSQQSALLDWLASLI